MDGLEALRIGANAPGPDWALEAPSGLSLIGHDQPARAQGRRSQPP
jgi:hypothetical protein